MLSTRRQLTLASLLLWVASQAQAAPVLPEVTSLPDSLNSALAHKQPLVVMVSLHGCAFCKVVRESYLYPLQQAGLPVVQINMRDSKIMTDLEGVQMTQDAWVRKQGIKVHLLFCFWVHKGVRWLKGSTVHTCLIFTIRTWKSTWR